MQALRESLAVFKSCPRFNNTLTDSDLERFVSIIGPLHNPKNIVGKLVLKMQSTNAVLAFQNEKFLKEHSFIR